MSTFLNPQLMRKIIMDHYSNPRNKRTPTEPGYLSIHMDSASCIDDIYVYIKVKDDVIEDVAFDGIGCAISMSTASIMTELLKGLKRDKALYIIEQYKNMLLEKPFDESVLDEAIVFINTHKQASRIKCATLAWDGAETLLTEDKHE